MSNSRGWRPLLPDVALALGVAGLLVLNVSLTVGETTPFDYAVLVVGALALAALRRAPRVVLAVSTACALSYFLRVQPDITAAIPVLMTTFVVVRTGHRLIAVAATGVLLAGAVVFMVNGDEAKSVLNVVQSAFLIAGWFVAALVMGQGYRSYQAYVHEVEERAAEAERTREETALRRASEERLRIARELHDSLTHSISIIKVQAGVAIHLAHKRGEAVSDSLQAIQEASSDAMRELRATLEVIRAVGDADQGSGLDRLDDLVERVRSAGLTTTVTISGERRTLPAAVDRAAYRIVQESLTNVSRHAGETAASVHIGFGDRELVVQVDDDGDATPHEAPTPGVGLSGMRERVAALGGRLEAQPRPAGGFTVRAELPVVEAS